MALYIEPPTGNISLQKLEAFALKRLEFLMKVIDARGKFCRLHELVCDETTVKDSECLIVGSAKDKVSHFILRLLVGGDAETQAFFCKAETALFDFHFSCMTEEEIHRFFHRIDRLLRCRSLDTRGLIHANEFQNDDSDTILRTFSNIKQSADSWKQVTELYMAQCSQTYFFLPFQSVLHLLARRQVHLERGMARIPFCKLREVVGEQFSSLLQLASRQAVKRLKTALQEERLKDLWRKLKCTYRRHQLSFVSESVMPALSHGQVDSLASHLPLCMSALLRSLRHKHRLGHHARIQLTLFLKDVGLPLHAALALWQQEYSQAPSAHRPCRHSWQRDARRYTYSIRHLYGLEGSRRNYRGHCCQSLQDRVVGCNEEGGCPFSLWDDASLSNELLKRGMPSHQVRQVMSVRATGDFSGACRHCLCRSVEQDTKAGGDSSPTKNTSHPLCQRNQLHPSPEGLLSADCCDVTDGNKPCQDIETLGDASDWKKKAGSYDRNQTAKLTNCVRQKRKIKVVQETQLSAKVCKIGSVGNDGTDRQVCTAKIEKLCTSVFVAGKAERSCFGEKHKNCADPQTDLKKRPELSLQRTCCEDDKMLLVHASPSTNATPACEKLRLSSDDSSVESKCQIQCCDHDTCPSQKIQSPKHAFYSDIQTSIQIHKPEHYFRMSYQLMLENMKS